MWEIGKTLRFMATLGMAGVLLALSAQAAPPSRAFLELPAVRRYLGQAGLEARRLEPEVLRGLRRAELDFAWRGRMARSLSESSRLAVALERSGIEMVPLSQNRLRAATLLPSPNVIQQDARGSVAELLERYVEQGAINRPELLLQRLQRSTSQTRWSAAEVLDEIFVERAQLVDELEELAERVAPARPRLATEALRAAENIRVSEQEVSRALRRYPHLTREGFLAEQHERLLGGYGGVVAGELGELLVFARENHAQQRGLLAGDLGAALCCGERAIAAARAIRAEAGTVVFDREIDVLFENLSAIGEVKTYQNEMTLTERSFSRVYLQAENLKALRDRLLELPAVRSYVGPTGIQLRIYFNGGIDDAARLRFEQLGFEVFGTGEATTRIQSLRAG